MLHHHFLTWQPAAHRMLVNMVNAVQDGRLMLFLGAPEFTSWLQDDAAHTLMNLGSRLGARATRGEAWVFAVHKGHAQAYETLITSRNSTASDVSPLMFSTTIPLSSEKRCAWYQEPPLATKATFCETYEGYNDFCHCHHPLHLHPHTAPLMKMEEVIPIALVTAKRFPMVVRQVRQLWENPGGRQTPLALLVDGYDPQAEALARLLNLTVTFHDNPVPRGTKHRVNQHIKFSLQTIFQLYPEVDKAIILEDDLSLAPDFVSYFQQTASLMNVDKTVLCVNAYSYNAFPHTASDPRRIYRVQSYPYYGWMTSRTHAHKMLSNWAPLDIDADWDLYSRQNHVDQTHEVIIPEVPRTRHEGGAGLHVTNLEQEITFDQRPLNTLPNVKLNVHRHWHHAYAQDRTLDIRQATVVTITRHPCVVAPVPRYQKNTTYVIYMNHTRNEDKEISYKVLAKCLGFYHQNLYENYRQTFSIKFFETPIILVACWSSAYWRAPTTGLCDCVPDGVIYQPTTGDLQYAEKHPWRHSNASTEITWRVPPHTPEEEFRLNNVRSLHVVINE
ncbi:protein O-linked-mannose beta-1,2-N-acetylglucosaminyltransferase 1-like [Panulirus ornatus]|uniref:protein O-linked-mannose beta-1,2-N-acetylglucosaminyltransferase 1-like n=1 Tax=Panulirus ornatus TaxID=150431 RepID=UPI003A88BBB3